MTSIEDMVGKTFTKVTGTVGGDVMRFETASGEWCEFWHQQDCCEHVSINDIIGNLSMLENSPLLMAECISSAGTPAPEPTDSYTWTFYKFATIKGYVTVRWLGESNGYYSEHVDFRSSATSKCYS